MTVTRGEVERIAALARLKLGPEEAARLTGDLNGILDHVAELREVPVEGIEAEGVVEGAAPLRDPDAPPDPLLRPPSSFAPDWREGFFAVPRLPAVDGGEAATDGEVGTDGGAAGGGSGEARSGGNPAPGREGVR